MVKWVCSASDDIDVVLKMKGTKLKRKCIHLAIESARSGKGKTARDLVDLAWAETLSDKYMEGNTPLSLAVEYSRRKESQIKLIEAIVEMSDYFIRDLPEHDFNNAHQSPYMHHLVKIDADRPKVALAKPDVMEEQRQRRPEPGSRPLIPKLILLLPWRMPSPYRAGRAGRGRSGQGWHGSDGQRWARNTQGRFQRRRFMSSTDVLNPISEPRKTSRHSVRGLTSTPRVPEHRKSSKSSGRT